MRQIVSTTIPMHPNFRGNPNALVYKHKESCKVSGVKFVPTLVMKKVLVIDDDPDILLLVHILLNRHGFLVEQTLYGV